MGYASKVCIRTTPKGMGAVEAAWDAAAAADGMRSGMREDCDWLYESGDVATVGWMDAKWCGWPEQRAVELLLADGLGGEPWSFVRIGEEPGDVEQLYSSDGIPERYILYADGYIEDASWVPLVPDFNLHEFTALIMAMHERLAELDPEFDRRLVDGSRVLSEMVGEYERQIAERTDDGDE